MTGAVEAVLGAGWLTANVGARFLPGTALGPVRITRGRRGPLERFAPAVCTLVTTRDQLSSLPALREAVTVQLSAGALAKLRSGLTEPARSQVSRRFTGEVTDVSVELHPDPALSVVTIICTSWYAALRRVPLNEGAPFGSYAAQLDGPRAQQLLGEALADAGPFSASAFVDQVDNGTATVESVTRAASAATAGKLLDELAAQTRGEVREKRGGGIDWHDADHRADPVTPSLQLLPADVLLGTTAALDASGVVNQVTVTYGMGADPRPTVSASNASSRAVHGTVVGTVDAPLLSSGAAQGLANYLVNVQGVPRWAFDRLDVDVLRTVSLTNAASELPATWAQQTLRWDQLPTDLRWSSDAGGLVALEVDDPLAVDGAASAGGPWAGVGLVWLEGITETLTRDAWRLQLTVSQPTPDRPRRVSVPGPFK